MHDPSSAFTAEDQQRHPYISSVLEPSTQKVVATAGVRIYYAPFNNPHLNWSYSKLKGILVFGRDRDTHHGTSPPKRGGHGVRLKEKYWFRLVDMKTDRVVWTFSIPEVFEYTKDKPFFHYFSGTSRMFGLCFDEDEEASVFYKKVSDRTRHHFFQPFLFKSSKDKKEKKKAPKSSSVSTRLISSPAPHSFVHVAHVGITTRGIIESSKNIKPAWSTLMADLQGCGVAPEIVKDDKDFVEGFMAGAKAMSDKPTAVQPHPPTSPVPPEKRKIRRKAVTIL
ncbi:uncharacterized protein HD556DRAFT_1330865 [Suillus plorans]|uniref:Uncharacterized protein n=1 Tax=Suillus plorans TaxID=116603 RepID=A0A9P7DVK4_9AGAM|nr:uncharacterized protein HD556DRAFT_1330865 [Suillus plorans]KAG1803924.1 hypothetical protein HD556DRAFT_1330865 [Suillus plorans]